VEQHFLNIRLGSLTMTQQLTLELNDEVYAALKQQAKGAGLSLSDWIVASLVEQLRENGKEDMRTKDEQEVARQRFRSHAGSINLGYATGADNESIDADLARAYENEAN
jgi:hypothetical protein